MKTKKIILFFLIISVTIPQSRSQGFYLKASSNTNFSTFDQRMPQYFDFPVLIPTTGIFPYSLNLATDKFSVSAGQNYQATVGYALNDFVSFELKFSRFNNSKNEFNAQKQYLGSSNGTSYWNLRTVSFLPTILLGQTFKKSRINIFLYAGVALNKLNIEATKMNLYGRKVAESVDYEFDRNAR